MLSLGQFKYLYSTILIFLAVEQENSNRKARYLISFMVICTTICVLTINSGKIFLMIIYHYIGKLFFKEGKHNDRLVPSMKAEEVFMKGSMGGIFVDPDTICLRPEDRLIVFNDKDEIIFDEVIALDRKPPHDYKFRLNFVPKLDKADLDFLDICFSSNNKAKIVRKS